MKSDRTINILPLVLLLAIITTTVVVENIYAQSDEKQTAPSEHWNKLNYLHIQNGKIIAQLF